MTLQASLSPPPTDATARRSPAHRSDGDARTTDPVFNRLWESERPRVWRLIARLSNSPDAADDLTQEVGLRALEGYGNFQGRAAASTWLFRIAVNVVQRWREQQQQWREEAVPEGRETTAPEETSPERLALQAEVISRTRRALDRLPDDLRTPLVLHAWEGMKYREIAAVLEVPLGTVMSRLHAARQRMRKECGDDDAM